MGIFSPYALQAGFEGADLATQLRVKQLQEQAARMKLDEEARARQARALIGRVLQQAGVADPTAIPQSPAPGQPSVPMQRPGAVQQRAPMPGPGTGGNAPQPMQMPETGIAGNDNAGQAAPPSLVRQPARLQNENGLDWNAVAQEVQRRTGEDPAVIFAAMEEIRPQLEKQNDREARADLQRAQLDQKNYALMENLKWRYANTASATERAQIQAEMRRLTTQMVNDTRLQTTAMNNASAERRTAAQQAGANARNDASIAGRKEVAGLNNARAIYLGELNNRTKADIAQARNDLEKEIKTRGLDLKQLEIDDTMAVKQRALDLQAIGMEKKDAQFYAKLEVTKDLAAMRDATTRRGQDMVSADKRAALDNKIDIARGKSAGMLAGVTSDIDQLIADANALLETDPDVIEDATGPIESRLPTLYDSTANFEAALESLKSQIGFAALSKMRQLSPTGGALGNVSNYESQQLQKTLAALDLRQGGEALRNNILKVIQRAGASKMQLLNAYEKQYATPKGSPGGVPVPKPGDTAGAIDTPAAVGTEPDGTVFEMGGKRYTKQGAKSVPVK